MIVNIYTSLNGVGLERDYFLVKKILEQKGHDCPVADWKIHQGAIKGDVAIHMEVPRYDLMRHCPINILIVNAEWFDKKWLRRLNQFTEIWTKTIDGEKIFKRYHRTVINCGFISDDLYDPDIKKQKAFIHVAGQSMTKGTKALVDCYKKNPKLPKCFLVSANQWECNGNLIYAGRVNFENLKVLLNACQFHICTSEYEGWGHYIHEALSCKAVVISTDSAPMNEFITDPRCLVPEYGTIPMHMALRKLIHPDQLAERMQALYKLSDDELIKIGEENRKGFLLRSVQFKKFLLNKINEFKG